MNEEDSFCLSDNIKDGRRWLGEPVDFILEEDVKEFIRLLKEVIKECFYENGRIRTSRQNILTRIDNLAGDKLIWVL